MEATPQSARRDRRYGLRPVHRTDDATIERHLRAAYAAFGPAAVEYLETGGAVESVSAAFVELRAAYFVITDERSGEVVGGAGIRALPGTRPQVCELREVWLAPEARGQGQSTGLVEHCLVTGLAFGYRQCYAQIAAPMRAAAALLRASGFSRLDRPLAPAGAPLCDLWYLRDI